MASKKLTPAVLDSLIAYVAEGLPIATAASLCGLSRQLVQAWRNQGAEYLSQNEGEPGTDQYAQLVSRLDVALAEYQARLVRLGHRAIEDPKAIDFKAVKALLAVRFPVDYAHVPQAPAAPTASGPLGDVDLEDVRRSLARKLETYLTAAETPVAHE